MTGQELERRDEAMAIAIRQVRKPEFVEQIRESLPENVAADRFVRVTMTALRLTPELVLADQTSLFGSIVKCAQDGLLPDGREAALVIYKGKVGYIPMIGGLRKIAAEHGWALRTQVVYANDEFDYTEEPPEIRHRPVRPGAERGDIIAAYAVARHADGRRMQKVLHPDDIQKRRAIAQTDRVWSQWPAPMWEKTAGRDLFGELPLANSDRAARVLAASAASEPGAAADLLYGPQGQTFTATPAPALGDGSPQAESGGSGQQAEGAPAPDAGSQPHDAPTPAVAAGGTDAPSAPGTIYPDEPPDPAQPVQASLDDASGVFPWDTVRVGGGKYGPLKGVRDLGMTVGEIAEADPAYVRDYLAVKVPDEQVRQAAKRWAFTHPAAA